MDLRSYKFTKGFDSIGIYNKRVILGGPLAVHRCIGGSTYIILPIFLRVEFPSTIITGSRQNDREAVGATKNQIGTHN